MSLKTSSVAPNMSETDTPTDTTRDTTTETKSETQNGSQTQSNYVSEQTWGGEKLDFKKPIIVNETLSDKELQTEIKNKFDGSDVGSGFGNLIASSVPQMDDDNKKAAQVLATQGEKAAVQYMFQHPTEKDGDKPRQMSYSEMRMRYG